MCILNTNTGIGKFKKKSLLENDKCHTTVYGVAIMNCPSGISNMMPLSKHSDRYCSELDLHAYLIMHIPMRTQTSATHTYIFNFAQIQYGQDYL